MILYRVLKCFGDTIPLEMERKREEVGCDEPTYPEVLGSIPGASRFSEK
jgi:hypothetical protein